MWSQRASSVCAFKRFLLNVPRIASCESRGQGHRLPSRDDILLSIFVFFRFDVLLAYDIAHPAEHVPRAAHHHNCPWFGSSVFSFIESASHHRSAYLTNQSIEYFIFSSSASSTWAVWLFVEIWISMTRRRVRMCDARLRCRRPSTCCQHQT